MEEYASDYAKRKLKKLKKDNPKEYAKASKRKPKPIDSKKK